MAELIGQQLGQYKIISILGEGGMATVYRAQQTTVSRDVAVKVIETKLARDSEFVTRFRREAETIATLDHPHILKLFDFGQRGDLLYLVMELKLGGTLAQRLKQKPLSLDEVERLIAQLTEALDYAHRKGIIHRDIKPQNVLLDESGNAALTDFGIAKVLTSERTALTQSGISMGTPHYMSPEQWRGEKVDSRADLYALGVMLYEILAGDIPFKADTPSALMYKHLMEPVPSLARQRKDITPPLDAVISRTMAKTPTGRFQTGHEILVAFRDARRGIMPPPPPTDPAQHTPTSIPRPDAPTVSPYDTPTAIAPTGPQPTAPKRRSPLPILIGLVTVALIGVGALLATNAGGGITATPQPSRTEEGVSVVQAVTDTLPPPTETASLVPPSATPLPPSATETPLPPTATPGSTAIPILTHTFTPRPTLTPSRTPTNTLTPSRTLTNTPTLSATDLEATVLALIEQENRAAAQTERANQTATSSRATQDRRATNTQIALLGQTATQSAQRTAAILTMTASAWTKTPTLDLRATANARLTQTRAALIQTATATAWTRTPTPTRTPTITPTPTTTFTPTPTPTETPTPTPTETPVLIPAGTSNSVWTPQERDFDGVTMVLVPAGCFLMGSEDGDNDEEPVHEVCITKPFWLDKYEVSNGQFNSKGGQAVRPSYWTDINLPRESITWTEANAFCELRGARLPTEAEWEYAARGPQSLIYPWGNDFIAGNAAYRNNSKGRTSSIYSKMKGVSWVGANSLSGNVWEWVFDWYLKENYISSPKDNPAGPAEGLYRVARGGSWGSTVGDVRGAVRYKFDPGTISVYGGFRCARDVDGVAVSGVITGTPTETPAPTPIPAGTSNSVWTPQERDFDGVTMVLVPAGCFLMGSEDGDNEKPVHEVCITKPFWLDKYEVSNGQFNSKGGQAGRPSTWTDINLPRESITWTEANAFCQLREARLPTEAEWEYAARGPQSLTYPWGNSFIADNVTYDGNSGGQTAPVESRPGGRSWVGAFNLSGNVWEWVADWYDSGYYRSSPKDDPTGPNTGDARVLRGGSWYIFGSNVRGASRVGYTPDNRSLGNGFRCASSL
jgi:formylglycine-generating enzyme required for sulfatase activity/serine/threonine protein kinase